MRAKSGVGYIGENYFADCQNFIRYPELKFISPLATSPDKVLMYPVYRRFFFDGDFCGRYELGFRLNGPTIDHINTIAEMRGHLVRYDAVGIANQTLKTDLELHLLDGRVQQDEAWKTRGLLRDGYLLSSTKNSALSEYDITDVGSKYVGVGSPFLVIRSTPQTPLSEVLHRRQIFNSDGLSAFVLSSGASSQGFDTLLIDSSEQWNDETAQERLARIVYTQLRVILFGYQFYLSSAANGNLSSRPMLERAISGLVNRIQTLTPIIKDEADERTCRTMRELLKSLDLNPEAIAREIEQTLRTGFLRRALGKVFGFINSKTDVAIEAAASTITEKVFEGRL